jgi:hypothetical protein
MEHPVALPSVRAEGRKKSVLYAGHFVQRSTGSGKYNFNLANYYFAQSTSNVTSLGFVLIMTYGLITGIETNRILNIGSECPFWFI